MKEEDTEQGRIRRVIDEEVQLPRTGVITNVREHDAADDLWNYEVDVKLAPGNEERKVPVATSVPNMTAAPRAVDHPDGPDLAIVQYISDEETERPVITGFLFTDKNRPEVGSQGLVTIRRGSLVVEAMADGSEVRLAHDDGSEVSVDDAGNITINATGDVTVSADGNVVIDEGGDAKPVARADHTHDFTYTGGGKNSGQLTGTTSAENEASTQTEIE